jgi:adenine deaminase
MRRASQQPSKARFSSIWTQTCVPASPYESAGATQVADDLLPLAHNPRIASIGEVMNFPGILEGDEVILDMIGLGQPGRATPRGLLVDGHGPELRGLDLRGYVAAGVQADHESVATEEGLEKARLGLRSGAMAPSVAHDAHNNRRGWLQRRGHGAGRP